MNTKLLKKARRNVILLNKDNEPAQPDDKFIKIVVTHPGKEPEEILTVQRNKYYSSYGAACNRQRRLIIQLAMDLQVLNWIKYVFY